MGNDRRCIKTPLIVIPGSRHKLGRAKAPAVERSQVTQYYNIESLATVQPRGFGAAEFMPNSWNDYKGYDPLAIAGQIAFQRKNHPFL